MTERFDIICNNCGQNLTLQPFQVVVTCSKCQTHLKIEETETRIETIIMTEQEFLTIKPTLILSDQISIQDNFQLLKNYEKELENLEKEWFKDLEKFKIKRGRKHTLPRRNQSIILTIIGVLIFIYSIFYNEKGGVLNTVGLIVLVTSGQELYKWWKYSKALENYEMEKERLEIVIQRLINSGL